MVERDIGRRAQHDEDAVAVDLPLRQHALVRLEVGEVVLLLQAGVAEQLGGLAP